MVLDGRPLEEGRDIDLVPCRMVLDGNSRCGLVEEGLNPLDADGIVGCHGTRFTSSDFNALVRRRRNLVDRFYIILTQEWVHGRYHGT